MDVDRWIAISGVITGTVGLVFTFWGRVSKTVSNREEAMDRLRRRVLELENENDRLRETNDRLRESEDFWQNKFREIEQRERRRP